MQFETAANPFIRPSVSPTPQPAYAALPREQLAETAAAPGVPDSPQETSRTETGAGDIHVGKGQEAAEELGFEDLIDVVNPLQHLPVVSNVYREVTGDEISAPARILGGFLYGGPVGFVASAVNAIAEEATGRDLGEAAMALVFGEEDGSPSAAETATQTAALDSAAETPAILLGGLPAPKASGFRAPPPPDLSDEAAAPQGKAAPLLTGDAALKALAADLGAAPPAAPAAPPAAAVAAPAAAAPRDAARLETAEAPAGVPANLIGIGTRDRRGLAPVSTPPRMPMPTDRLPNELPNRLPSHLPGAASAPTGQAMVDPTALPGAPLATVEAGDDFSVQLLDALKKYESMMQQRRAGG